MFLLFLFLFACASLCNAAPIEEKDGKTIITLKVPNLPDPNSKYIHSQASFKALELFKKDFPETFAKKYKAKYKANPQKYGNYNWDNVEINIVKYSGLHIQGVDSDLLAIASGNGPDILYINYRKSCNFIKNGFIIPLDEYYKTLTPEQIAWRIDPKVKPVARRKGPKGKIHWWTMPYAGVLGKAVVFRKDIFDKHKIPYPDKNWTWKDFLRICKKTTDISKNKYGLRLGSGSHESFFWTTFLWSAGGEITAYNKKTKHWEYAFDSDAAVKALDFYTQLSPYAYKDFRNINDMWDRGDIAMMFTYIDKIFITNIDIKKYGIVPVPLGPSGIRGSELNNRMYGINYQTKNTAVRDAAWEYMLHHDSLKSQKIMIETLIKGGKGTSINPIYLKEFGYDSIAQKVDKKLVETLNIVIATGIPEPYRAISSSNSYELMTYALNAAAKIDTGNKLAPVGSKKRYKQLKAILTHVCAYANKINNQELQNINKK
jgi:ABC-type glycerol-3-phosphate transport system substrate-binding protein